MIKGLEMDDALELSRWAQWNHKGPSRGEAGGSGWQKELGGSSRGQTDVSNGFEDRGGPGAKVPPDAGEGQEQILP